jgi:hypothetical protein
VIDGASLPRRGEIKLTGTKATSNVTLWDVPVFHGDPQEAMQLVKEAQTPCDGILIAFDMSDSKHLADIEEKVCIVAVG